MGHKGKGKGSFRFAAATTSCLLNRRRHLFLMLLFLASFVWNSGAEEWSGKHCIGNSMKEVKPKRQWATPAGGSDNTPDASDKYSTETKPNPQGGTLAGGSGNTPDAADKYSTDGDVACPVEPASFSKLKDTLPPVLLKRLKELTKKQLTIETALETAHTIDLLKLLSKSNSKLDEIREKMHNGSQLLKTAFDEIHEHIPSDSEKHIQSD